VVVGVVVVVVHGGKGCLLALVLCTIGGVAAFAVGWRLAQLWPHNCALATSHAPLLLPSGPCPQVESYQKQLAPQAAKLQEMSAQLAAQDTELVGGISTLVALRRQVSG
jgi:hypothetical protein